MPLSFQTQNHGNIAFGFFNIESDMLLLENLFFFADDFCRWMIEISKTSGQGHERFDYPVYQIENPAEIGDLMGAIHGMHFSGFIGEVYTHYPFPKDPSRFKQNPLGFQTREQMVGIIEKWAVQTQLIINVHPDGKVGIGPYLFLDQDFSELIRYVWRGGYPQWKDELCPDYVKKMKQTVRKSSHPSFTGVCS